MATFRKGARLLDTGMILVLTGLILMTTDVLGFTSFHSGFHWNVSFVILGGGILALAKYQQDKYKKGKPDNAVQFIRK